MKRLRDWLRALYVRVRDERVAPREIGFAVAAGVVAGCTPALGLHTWVALGVALALRLNKPWTWIGSRVSSVITLPWIALAQIEIAHRARTGAWLTLHADDVLGQARALLVDWLLGMIPVAGSLALLLGALAWAAAHLWQTRRS